MCDVHGRKLLPLCSITFPSVQSCPDIGIAPPLVTPSTAKLDLERFLRDLPKYKPWVSAESWEWWEEFVDKREDLDMVKPLPWVLPKLYASAETRPKVSSGTIPTSTAEMLEKETAQHKKVSLHDPYRF